MSDKEDEILQNVKEIKHKLYGISATDKGDIGEIKDDVKGLCTRLGDCEEVVNVEMRPRIVRLETIIKIAAGSGGVSGATAGVLKLLGVF